MRRTGTVTIARAGRDQGKSFFITEMPADQAERWAMRLLLAMANAGARMPEGTLEAGMAGIAATWQTLLVSGIRSLAGMRYEDVEPLLSEMMACVQFQASPAVVVPLMPGPASQIEDVQTRLQLRYEVLQLHVGFSLADALSTSTPSPSASAASA